jgi:hypothetical protein
MAFCLLNESTQAGVCVAEEARLNLCVPPKAWEDLQLYTRRWNNNDVEYVPIFYSGAFSGLGPVIYTLSTAAEACALAYHGSKEKLEAAKQAKAAGIAKAAATKLIKMQKREAVYKDLLAAAKVNDKSDSDIGNKYLTRVEKALHERDKYIKSDGGIDPLVIVRELCTVKLLVNYTPYFSDYRKLGQCGSHLEKIALRGLTPNGKLPGWWPWLQWTCDTHKFALDSFKEQVRTLLLVNNRSTKQKGLPVLPAEVMEMIVKKLAVKVTCKFKRTRTAPKKAVKAQEPLMA